MGLQWASQTFEHDLSGRCFCVETWEKGLFE